MSESDVMEKAEQQEAPAGATAPPMPACPECAKTEHVTAVKEKPDTFHCVPCLLEFTAAAAQLAAASNGADTETTPGRKFYLHLQVVLSQEEKDALMHQASEAADEIDELETQLKYAKGRVKGIQSDIEAKQERMTALVRICDAGTDGREVECQEVLDYRDNSVRTVRLDTGETVEERAMRDDERQLALLPPEAQPPAAEPDPDRIYEEARDSAADPPPAEPEDDEEEHGDDGQAAELARGQAEHDAEGGAFVRGFDERAGEE